MAWLLNIDKVENWAYADNVFSAEECKKIIEYTTKNKDKKIASVVSKNKDNIVNKKIRQNKVSWLSDKDDLKWMYERLTDIVIEINSKYFNFDLYGFCEDIQFTEYGSKGDHYKVHMDKMLNGPLRKLSVVVQLTDPKEYTGGNLELFTSSNPTVIEKKIGKVVFFPSYILHQVTPVTKGTRHTLVAWVSGANFR